MSRSLFPKDVYRDDFIQPAMSDMAAFENQDSASQSEKKKPKALQMRVLDDGAQM
jgi:hypothetical protein